jgi:glycosyltransferase involved in cell wall biosynthesis
MHIAIVDEELPYPPNSGKRIRTYQLISRLARRHRITYVCHRNADHLELDQAVTAFHDLGVETVVVDRPVPPKSGLAFYGRLAANLVSPLPYSVASHRSASLDRAIRDLAARDRVDLWQAEWTPYAASLQGLKNARRLIIAHNVESQIWRRYWEQEPSWAKRWYIGQQWRKYERFEGRVCRQADRIVAVSHEDAALIRDQFGATHVAVVENGVDTAFFRPDRCVREQGLLLFLGSLDWRPNLDAVDQLLSTIFPAVRAQEPGARLWLVGRNPPEALRRRAGSTRGVELHASVPDVRPFLERSMLLVVPIRIGGGSRLKILEAFAAGLPVISTRIGAEGLKVQNGVHLAVVENIAGMASEIVSLMNDPERRSSLAREGRALAESHYEWERLAGKLGRIWTSFDLAQEPTEFALA